MSGRQRDTCLSMIPLLWLVSTRYHDKQVQQETPKRVLTISCLGVSGAGAEVGAGEAGMSLKLLVAVESTCLQQVSRAGPCHTNSLF